jgi:hypothetical protein
MQDFSNAGQAVAGAFSLGLATLKSNIVALQQGFNLVFANKNVSIAGAAAAAGASGVLLLGVFVAQLSAIVSLSTATNFPLPTQAFSLTPSDATPAPPTYTLVISSGTNAGTYTLTPNYSTGVVTVS